MKKQKNYIIVILKNIDKILINREWKNMKIIIPMTGYGSRFANAGYKDLKPFIKVNGKPIIEWIVKGMYSEDDEFLFICRKEHLDTNKDMESTLKKLAKNTKIFSIDKWEKNGPVFDVLKAKDLIDDNEPCIINYCDFYSTWDWKKFKNELKERKCDGCIPCYSGFHPHLLIKKNLYASCLTDEEDNLIEIREKYSFESDKTKAKHSPGVYYFKTGELLKKYCKKLIDDDNRLNGEFYASLPYNYMVKDNLKVWVPVCIDKFCQWGTPEDMQEYLFWIDVVRRFEND